MSMDWHPLGAGATAGVSTIMGGAFLLPLRMWKIRRDCCSHANNVTHGFLKSIGPLSTGRNPCKPNSRRDKRCPGEQRAVVASVPNLFPEKRGLH